MVTYKRVETTIELKQILDLQQSNLYNTLTAEERLQEGFVTVSHTLDVLMKMNEVCPHIIAKDKDIVVGYALCMHPRFSKEIDILKPMFQEIVAIIPKLENYLIMGQICVDKQYRKKGIFRNLYKTMKEVLQPAFDSLLQKLMLKTPAPCMLTLPLDLNF